MMLELLLLASAIGAPPPVLDEGVAIHDRVARYRIAGDSSRALHAQMRALGPVDPATGERYDAFARWNVSWRYAREGTGSRCKLDDIDVKLDVVITLPEWPGNTTAPATLAAGWPVYLARLEEHERGHRAIGIRAAKAVRAALAGLPRTDCAQVAARADAAAQAAMAAFGTADRDYDRETGHGAKRGVRLP